MVKVVEMLILLGAYLEAGRLYRKWVVRLICTLQYWRVWSWVVANLHSGSYVEESRKVSIMIERTGLSLGGEEGYSACSHLLVPRGCLNSCISGYLNAFPMDVSSWEVHDNSKRFYEAKCRIEVRTANGWLLQESPMVLKDSLAKVRFLHLV